jgi:hypothetical protein
MKQFAFTGKMLQVVDKNESRIRDSDDWITAYLGDTQINQQRHGKNLQRKKCSKQ